MRRRLALAAVALLAAGCGSGTPPQVTFTAADSSVTARPTQYCDLKLTECSDDAAAPVRLAVPGLYNVYNALAAASVALALGMQLEAVAEGLGRFRAAFGRFERFRVDDRGVLLLLVKNPAGANEALRTLEDGGVPPTLVLALNDRIADGRDVSWIWDVDFEPVLERVERIVASGERAAELALRFTYAGLPRDRLELVPDLETALDRGLELTPAGGELVILPTYTAMLELRAIGALAVHLDAVRRAEVDHEPVAVLAPHLRVASRDVGVVQCDVALARAAEHDDVTGELIRLSIDLEPRAGLVREPELLRLGGRDRGRGRGRRCGCPGWCR